MELTMGALKYYLIGVNILGFILYGINTLLYRFTADGQIDAVLTITSFLGGSLGMVRKQQLPRKKVDVRLPKHYFSSMHFSLELDFSM